MSQNRARHKSRQPEQQVNRVRSLAAWIAAAAVFAVTFFTFAPALNHEFVDWDDTDNFVRNPHYRGLAWENIKWMFTTFWMGHYQPLTWLSLGFDSVWGEAVWG